jgi:hypothetical protein
MSKAKETGGLVSKVADERWIEFFYLRNPVEKLFDMLHGLTFTFIPNSRDIPFHAQVRGYKGARDNRGELWILKEVEDGGEFFYSLCELAYYLDSLLETLSAPTLLVEVDGVYHRATKVIVESTQISGYNYLEEPLRKVLANDLINRWWMFDEDRNPNNYMVIQNAQRLPLVVAIDFNHADLECARMKITGNEKQFGWFREEKTRFLTLLKPENFEIYGIDDFEDRLSLLMGIPESRLKALCLRLFNPVVGEAEEKAELITKNLISRREHINAYFRKWFKRGKKRSIAQKESEYKGLGSQFVEIYKKKI